MCSEFEYNHEIITEQLEIGKPFEKSIEFFENIIVKEHGIKSIWLGIYLNNGTIIGEIHFHDIDKLNRSCYIGMRLTKLEYRNKGYGKESLKLLLDYGFYNYGFERIAATTWESNILAQKSLEKLGFLLEGKERKAIYCGGKKYDKYRYGLLIEDYREK